MPRIKPASHEDRFTIVEHLDELRFRVVVALIAFGVALGLCMWQSPLLLDIANGPLPGDFEPITFSVSEPFMTTLTVAAYGALILSLPVILYQAYAFLLPAFTPKERGIARPLVILIPVLFVAGVVFGYFIVLPAATNFMLGFNSTQFDVQVRAREYYGFFATTLVALGILFQVPVVVLALTRLGVLTPEKLSSNRRYAVLVIAVIAMLLPGTDPLTMLISMLPLYLLFEFSIVLSKLAARKQTAADGTTAPAGPSG